VGTGEARQFAEASPESTVLATEPNPQNPIILGRNPLKTRQIHFLTYIAYCNITITISDMTLGEKIRYLREVEGSMRGLERPMTQQELVRAVRKETGKSISQSYVSQIEGGSRPHMTQATRTLLAKFFKVHPGFLVDDPDGYHTELVSDLRTIEGKLDVWLLQGSERFASDPEVSEVMIQAAREKDTRRCFILLGAILDTPELADRLLEALKPAARAHAVRSGERKRSQ
jgi:transcriptional regulator with XRE-family HTH domain